MVENHGTLVGNIVEDPKLRLNNKGAVTTLRMAINRSKNETLYTDVTFWDKKAELICEHLKKGRKIAVSYYLKNNTYEKDGAKINGIELVGTDFHFFDKKED